MAIVYRSEVPGDISAIHAVNQMAFSTDAEARLVDVLRALRQADRIHGCRGCRADRRSYCLQPGDDERSSLAPMGLDWRRLPSSPLASGAASAAGSCGRVLPPLLSVGFRFVVVLGNPDYYHRFGFIRASDVWPRQPVRC